LAFGFWPLAKTQTQNAEVYANLCPSTRKPRVDGARWDDLG
jgi:hypothetical protein